MIGQDQRVCGTHEEWRDIVVFTFLIRCANGHDCCRWLTIEETGEQSEIVELSRRQRLEGADMFGPNNGAYVTILSALRARSA